MAAAAAAVRLGFRLHQERELAEAARAHIESVRFERRLSRPEADSQ